MQIKVILKTKKDLRFPLAYNYQLQSAIYRTINYADPEFSQMLHNEARYKLFAFSQLSGDTSIVNGKLCVKKGSKISFELRSPSDTLCEIFKAGLLKTEHMSLFDQTLDVSLIDSTDKHIFDDELYITMRSPLVVMGQDVENRKSYFYAPENDEFKTLVSEFFATKYTDLYEDVATLAIDQISGVKKCVTRYKSMWITGYYLNAVLSGNPRELDLAYNCGIGNCNSKGFGMFDAIDN